MDTKGARKLAGKVALVTGGSRGIGAAIVRCHAADGEMAQDRTDSKFQVLEDGEGRNAL